MSENSIEAVVIQAIATQKMIETEGITASTALADLDISSLDVFSIAFELEEQLQVSIPTESLGELTTVQSVVDKVVALGATA